MATKISNSSSASSNIRKIVVTNTTIQVWGLTETQINRLYRSFSIFDNSARFNPLFKKKLWDGYHRFGKIKTDKFSREYFVVPIGLYNELSSKMEDVLDLTEKDFEVEDSRDLDLINLLSLDKIPSDYKLGSKSLRDYQIEAVNNLIGNKWFGLPMPSGVINGSTNSGKCLSVWDKCVTDSGYVDIGDIRVGDYIYCEDGEKHKVLDVFYHANKPLYKVTFSDGSSVECCDEHLWAVQEPYDRRYDCGYKVRKLSDILQNYKVKGNGNGRSRYSIPVSKVVNFPNKPVKLNSWLLGLLIGDGSISRNSIGFTNVEQDIIDRATSIIESYGDCVVSCHNGKDYRITGGNIKALLKEYGLLGKHSWEKFIPKDYMLNDVQTRLEILRGLNDSDGYCGGKNEEKQNIEYSTTSKQLADDIKFIVCSLSGYAKIIERQGRYTKDGEIHETRLNYRVYERFYDPTIVPISSKKHLSVWRPRKKNPIKYIKNIEYVRHDEAVCIYVDNPTHLFLTTDFIVTHNTAVGSTILLKEYKTLKDNDLVMLFMVHSLEIANQFRENFKNDTGIECGFIGDSKWDVKPITVALTGTLYSKLKRKEDCFDELIDKCVGIVYDEVHHATAESSQKIIPKLKNLFIRVGLTGTTNERDEIKKLQLFSVSGSVLIRVSNKELIEKGVSAKPTCYIYMVNKPVFEYNPRFWHKIYEEGIAENEHRNKLIAELIKKEYALNHSILVLVERIAHGDNIAKYLTKLKKVEFIKGLDTGEDRQQAINDLASGKIKVLIATAILDEGVDVSGINTIVYARGLKSERKLLQGIGRGLRKKADGSGLTYIDFYDTFNSYLQSHSEERIKTLKDEGFDVIIKSGEEEDKDG